jgi:hypothetical protein
MPDESTNDDSSDPETDTSPTVACTLTPDQLADRTGELAALRDYYRGVEAAEDGVTVRFDGADDALLAVAEFVTNERVCCAFANYAIETAPPYEETRLTVTGPEGTETMFDAGFIELLEV